MKTLLQINVVVNKGSTGRIAEEIGQKAIAAGWESYIAYGRDDRPSQSHKIKIGSNWDMRCHGLQTRVLDNHSLCMSSRNATKKLVKQIEDIKPDIIHLHNLHGYYINIEVLFDYLATKDIPIVMTLHDCWSFAGHCSHYVSVGCEKWKTECYECPLKNSYPASYVIDNSRNNYRIKKRLFNSVNNLTIVPVSDWLEGEVNQSFLNKHDIKRIYNGVDTSVFKPQYNNTNVREKYNIGSKFMLMGVATSWSKSKGWDDYMELSKRLSDDEVIVLVGLTEKKLSQLPTNIIGIKRTDSTEELAELYSAADIVLSLSYQETFGLTSAEGMSCGTPSIVYNRTASPELITKDTGFVVEAGNIDQLKEAIAKIKQRGKAFYSANCRQRVEEYFNKDDRYQEYLELYDQLTDK